MKHKLSITFIMLGLFLIAQLFGLFIIANGSVPELFRHNLESQSPASTFLSIILSFIIAITIFFFLIQYQWKFFLRIWFALVILLTIGIMFNSLFFMYGYSENIYFYYSLLIALPFVLLKLLRPAVIIHNLTEIFIYAGLSLIFVSLLNPMTVVLLLVLISFYDMWAVWHSGIMQKMAKFQMTEMKIFNGFLIPYLTKEMKEKIKKLKKTKKKGNMKVPVAILGGGDIAFTLIPAGVFLKSFGWVPALFVVFGGFIGLTYLLFNSHKKRFYPAMPFITLGIFFGILLSLLFGFL